MDINDLSGKIISAAVEVHELLGPGLPVSTYERRLANELSLSGIDFKLQHSIPLVPVEYEDIIFDFGYRVNLLVENKIIVDLKCEEKMLPVYDAQMLTYLKMAKMEIGLLINFSEPVLKDGIKWLVN